MRKQVLILCLAMLFLAVSRPAYSDHATPLAGHMKRIKASYRDRDYSTTVLECNNALYHGRQQAAIYSYLAKAYEKLDNYLLAAISYKHYSRCCKPASVKKARLKLKSLKKKIDKAKFERLLDKIPDSVLISKTYYKKTRFYRIRDYIYNPIGQIIEEKYCRSSGENEYRFEYLYDEDGNLTDKIKYDGKNGFLSSEHITYKDGKKFQEEMKGPTRELISRTEYKYAPKGYLKNVSTYDIKDQLIFKKTFLYDKKNILEETSKDYINLTSLDNFTAKNTYKDGRLVRKDIKHDLGLSESVKYFYLKKRLDKEIYYNSADVPIRSKKYRYDSKGVPQGFSEYKIINRKRESLQTKETYKYGNPCMAPSKKKK